MMAFTAAFDASSRVGGTSAASMLREMSITTTRSVPRRSIFDASSPHLGWAAARIAATPANETSAIVR
jgi:hypothetical protein